MSDIFLILFLLSPVALLAGLIKPNLFSKYLPTRKKIALAFSSLTVLSFILFGITAPPTEKTEQKGETKVESQQVTGEQTEASPSPSPTSTPTPSPSPVPTVQPTPTPVAKATVKPTATTVIQTSCKYSCYGPDKDCSDFSTHAEAQAFFDCCGFSATYDPMKLDTARGDGNGIACESLP